MDGPVEGSQGMLFVRPLVVLALGLVAAGVAWWVLMQEPPRGPTRLGAKGADGGSSRVPGGSTLEDATTLARATP